MKKTVSLILLLALGLATGMAKADFAFGPPINLGPTVNSPQNDTPCFISVDGLELYFQSQRPGGLGDSDIWVTTRETVDDDWRTPVNLGRPVNSPYLDTFAHVSADGLELHFTSTRPGGLGLEDIWVTRRLSKSGAWYPPVNLGPPVNTSARDYGVFISADGLEFYFNSMRPGGFGSYHDIYVMKRASISDDWGAPVNLGPVVNGPSHDIAPNLSVDGRYLFFSDHPWQGFRSGGFGNSDIWVASRPTTSDDWTIPVNLGPIINTIADDCVPNLSAGGSTLYFTSGRSGGVGNWDIWQAPILPIVDFNGDRIVDSADMCIMIDHWGENYSLCDIGPTPLGDGVVDVHDLVVLAEHLFEDLRIVAHWKFDETGGSIASDSINVHDGICHGEPLWAPNNGKASGALQFDGMDDYVSIPFVLNPGEGSFSVFAWIKGGAPGQAIMSQAESTLGLNSTWLCMDPSDGKLITSLNHPPFPPLESESVIPDGQWHHVGLVYDRDGLHRRLHVDGAQVAGDMGPVPAIGSNGGLYIGAGETLDATRFFSGLIDDVRIYDVALSAEEIENLVR